MASWAMSFDAWVWMGAWALVLLVVVVLLVREPRHQHQDPSSVLRDRFARGELSEQEFRRAMAALGDEPGRVADESHPPLHR